MPYTPILPAHGAKTAYKPPACKFQLSNQSEVDCRSPLCLTSDHLNSGAAMPAYIALLRAVNVGGTGKLPMADLKAMCEQAGFSKVKTYIASCNVLFQSAKSEAQVKKTLESALAAYAGKPVGVAVRTTAEMAAILAANPF